MPGYDLEETFNSYILWMTLKLAYIVTWKLLPITPSLLLLTEKYAPPLNQCTLDLTFA